jgi:hypothetical protein
MDTTCLRARGCTLCEKTSERPHLYLIDESSFERGLVRRQCALVGISRQGLLERFVRRQFAGKGGYHISTVRRLEHDTNVQGPSRPVLAAMPISRWQEKEITRP